MIVSTFEIDRLEFFQHPEDNWTQALNATWAIISFKILFYSDVLMILLKGYKIIDERI